jgi:Uma2 family endonuclease
MDAHPTTALFIIEVADTSLEYDRGCKASLYARAGIADYWIVNLVDNRVEVYRDPVPDPSERFGHRYSSRVDVVAPARVASLALPDVAIPVARIFPEKE